MPGVTHVLTHAEMPKLAEPPVPPAASVRVPMQDDRILYEGEPIAIVLAETLESAEHAASLVQADVEPAPFTAHPRGDRAGAEVPRESGYLTSPADAEIGDIEGTFAGAPVRHEATYVQPSRHHNPMEPSATLARWDEGTLTMVDATQWAYGVRIVMCVLFGIAPEQVRVRSPHTGGAFGCKGIVWPHQIVAAAAARIAGRPVRIVLSRAQMYSTVPYLPQMVQTVSLAASGDGRLAAIEHESINVTSASDDFVEFATQASQTTYAAPAIRVRQRVQRANVNLGTAMRAPVEGCGLWALGSAMNELAAQLRIDPIELRLANYSDVHPFTGQPWSSKKLRECYEQGARTIGWRQRPSEPERDGPWLVGQGMADCAMGTFRFPSSAEVRLHADGRAVSAVGDSGHRHGHSHGPDPDRVWCAWARAGPRALRDRRHRVAGGRADVRVLLDDGRRRCRDGRRPGCAREAAPSLCGGAGRGAGRRGADGRDEVGGRRGAGRRRHVLA